MTDKQIIIDDVDVSKCTCFDDGECLNPCETVTNCEASINCRYKQLKRKEQECEELKKQLEEESKLGHKTIQDESNTFFDLLKIQKELGYLKEALEKEFITYRLEGFVPVFTYKGYELDKLIGKNNELKSDNKHLNGLLDQALKELEEHREALEKIKELIQKEISDCEHCDDCASCEYNCCTKQILQICDEVNDV
jgi:DNA repair exonuclease SbcCD ATPase subunit